MNRRSVRIAGVVALLGVSVIADVADAMAATATIATTVPTTAMRSVARTTAGSDRRGLDRVDRTAIVRHCGSLGARQYRRELDRIELVCAPHAVVGGHPESLLWQCLRSADSAWSCSMSGRASERRVGQRDVLVSRGAAVPVRAAIDVVRFAAVTYDYTFNGRDLSAMIGGVCNVADAGQPFAGATSFSITCGTESLTVTRDCWQSRCRLYPAALGLKSP